MRNAYRVSVGKTEGARRDHYGDPGTQGEMILKLTLKKQYMRVLIGIIWLSTGCEYSKKAGGAISEQFGDRRLLKQDCTLCSCTQHHKTELYSCDTRF